MVSVTVPQVEVTGSQVAWTCDFRDEWMALRVPKAGQLEL